MQLASTERRLLDTIIDALSTEESATALRFDLAEPIMRLLRADYFASYVRDPLDRAYGARVAVNMDPTNLERYEQYYQFHDPLTPRMAEHRRAAIVDDVVERRELERSEFYVDFLARDGLHHGINYFAYRGGRHVGDLRLWRGRAGAPFDDSDRALLDLVGLTLAAQLTVADASAPAALPEPLAGLLTPREQEIALAVADGLTDGEICARFHISYGTARTHLGHIFEKWSVDSRLGIVAAVHRRISEFTDAPHPAGRDRGRHDQHVADGI